ncbi:MAG: PE family protein, partial [Micrococcales bacterium]|nr:PE family protein [Micrococcales bacterium]
GAGGTGAAGQALITISGNPGQVGISSSVLASAVGGNGGPGYLGLGTGYGNNAFTSLAQAAGSPGTSGTGAGGGGARGNAVATAGGNGGSGIIIIEFVA